MGETPVPERVKLAAAIAAIISLNLAVLTFTANAYLTHDNMNMSQDKLEHDTLVAFQDNYFATSRRLFEAGASKAGSCKSGTSREGTLETGAFKAADSAAEANVAFAELLKLYENTRILRMAHDRGTHHHFVSRVFFHPASVFGPPDARQEAEIQLLRSLEANLRAEAKARYRPWMACQVALAQNLPQDQHLARHIGIVTLGYYVREFNSLSDGVISVGSQIQDETDRKNLQSLVPNPPPQTNWSGKYLFLAAFAFAAVIVVEIWWKPSAVSRLTYVGISLGTGVFGWVLIVSANESGPPLRTWFWGASSLLFGLSFGALEAIILYRKCRRWSRSL